MKKMGSLVKASTFLNLSLYTLGDKSCASMVKSYILIEKPCHGSPCKKENVRRRQNRHTLFFFFGPGGTKTVTLTDIANTLLYHKAPQKYRAPAHALHQKIRRPASDVNKLKLSYD